METYSNVDQYFFCFCFLAIDFSSQRKGKFGVATQPDAAQIEGYV